MRKFFKRFLQITIWSTLLTFALLIGVTLFINPNQFKVPLQQYVLNETGHVLKIEGPIEWRWFPMLSLQLNQVVLEASDPFKGPMISCQSAKVEADPAALLTGKLFLNLKLDTVSLLLEKGPNGQSNWESLKQKPSSSKTIEVASTPSNNAHSSSNTSLLDSNRFVLNSIRIQNGQVTFQDAVKKTRYKLDNLNLSVDSLFSSAFQKPTPLSLSFNFENSDSKRFGIALSGQYALQNLDKVRLQNLDLKITLPDGKITELTGEATVQDLNTTPSIQGSANIAKLDLVQWLNTSNPAIPPVVSVDTSFKYQSSNLTLSSFKIHSKTAGDLSGAMDIHLGGDTLALKGNFASKQLTINQMSIESLKGNVIAKDNVFTIAPIDFQLNKTAQHATLQIDVRGIKPRYALTAEGKDFDINQLLAFFNIKNKLEGRTHYYAKLAATGNDLNEWKQSLTGEMSIEMTNGKFYGADLISLLKNAQENVYNLVNGLVNKQSLNIKNFIKPAQQKWITTHIDPKAITPFNLTKASVTINNGLLKNSDLLIDHTEYKILGTGTIDFNNLAIQYYADALLKKNPYPAEDKVANYLYTVPLPIKVTGTLDDPKVKPDLETYSNDAFKYVQQMVQKAINKAVDKAIDKAVDKAVEHGLHKALEQFIKH